MLSNLEMREELWLLWVCIVKTKVLLTNWNDGKFENVAALLGGCLTYEFDSVQGSIILS